MSTKNTEHFFCILFKGEATQFGKLDGTRFVRLPFGGASENSRSPLVLVAKASQSCLGVRRCVETTGERDFTSYHHLRCFYSMGRGAPLIIWEIVGRTPHRRALCVCQKRLGSFACFMHYWRCCEAPNNLKSK